MLRLILWMGSTPFHLGGICAGDAPGTMRFDHDTVRLSNAITMNATSARCVRPSTTEREDADSSVPPRVKDRR